MSHRRRIDRSHRVGQLVPDRDHPSAVGRHPWVVVPRVTGRELPAVPSGRPDDHQVRDRMDQVGPGHPARDDTRAIGQHVERGLVEGPPCVRRQVHRDRRPPVDRLLEPEQEQVALAWPQVVVPEADGIPLVQLRATPALVRAPSRSASSSNVLRARVDGHPHDHHVRGRGRSGRPPRHHPARSPGAPHPCSPAATRAPAVPCPACRPATGRDPVGWT